MYIWLKMNQIKVESSLHRESSHLYLHSNTDVHTVASLLKLYLRELPEPVIPYAKYEDFLSCAKLLGKEEEAVSQCSYFLKCYYLGGLSVFLVFNP